ncbi:hypothetical protein VHEMI03238 [[Torrubiella] hemipterigena]|uniref:Uncharacterized protein n=1 Tax=[Torrubiella] hemipterigena TaxID=1531966 RepID=A0A0A1SS25_9HYPO|nr:hypothetical protein VHEMI03238 [[Torrubiella] hemipterigena]
MRILVLVGIGSSFSFVAEASFLNHTALLAGLEDPVWFEKNIPILQIPDKQVQEVYYYRWQTYKEHIVYTGPQYGYLLSEFLYPVGYGAPYGGIVAAAGHHINEGRWLRDQIYGNDLINYWLAGPGQFNKPADDGVNKDTNDWAHEYSFWAASSVWRRCTITGDRDFAIGQLDNLVKQYRGWDNHFNSDLGLYWQVPVWDATEFTAASYESSDPYHGGAGFRPTINAYQYGDARAIAALAKLKGDNKLADEYSKRADALQAATQAHLWDDEKKFFMHRATDNNPNGSLLTTREIMGYIPWMFGLANASNAEALLQLKDSQGFAAQFGPTTAERRSKWFMHEAENCCRWDGPSWPYATSQTLTAVENLLNDYPAQTYLNNDDYVSMLRAYALTQHKGGKPYVAEAHHPDNDVWIYDGNNHSEDYNHSTFVDNVLAGLLGLRGQAEDSLVVNPLANYDYFAVENVQYHGRDIGVIWDKDGTHFGQGKGLTVYLDGKAAAHRDDLGRLKINVGSGTVNSAATKVNIAANGQKYRQGTKAFASYTSPYDDAWRAIDGIVWRTGIPENTRWTSYKSPNASDYFGVDFQRLQAIEDVRLFFYDDQAGVRLPTSYDVQYLDGNNWKTIPGQQRSSAPTASNTETRITFSTIVTSQLRVVAPNRGNGGGWGLSELEVWADPIFQFRNENSGKLMGVENMSHANSANIQQYDDNGTRDHLWKFFPAAGGWFKIMNMNSGLLLAVEHMSGANSAHVQQYEDNGSEDQLWRVVSKGDGLFLIKNKNSGLVLGVDGESTANSANVVQFEDNGTRDHLWSILSSVPTA